MWLCSGKGGEIRRRKVRVRPCVAIFFLFTPFAVHYEKIRIQLRETATNSAKINSLARKSEHLRINQIQ